jgi:hypothetical protein
MTYVTALHRRITNGTQPYEEYEDCSRLDRPSACDGRGDSSRVLDNKKLCRKITFRLATRSLESMNAASRFTLPRRRGYFLGRKFGQMKTKKTRHDVNSKKIRTATRTDKNCT